MKILIYTHEFVPYVGGVATYNYELAKGLYELGQDVIVLAPKYSSKDIIFDKQLPFSVIRTNLSIRSIMRLNRNSIKLPVSVYSFLKTLRRHNPDRVLITQAVAHESAALARIFYPFKFVLIVYGTEIRRHFAGRRLKRWLKSRLMHWFFHKADRIICISKATKKLLEQNTDNLLNKILIIYPGIDHNEVLFKKNSEKLLKRFNLFNQKIILTVARLANGKGQDIVIQALPKIIKKVPNIKYLVVGDGPNRFKLEKLAKDLGVQDMVLFTGFVNKEDLGNFYEICDVFIMLSRDEGTRVEGFGLVFLEAFAHEKAVIGGNSGGVSEVVEHKKTGFLIKDPTDVNAVAKAVIRLLKNKKLAKSMGRRGRKKTEKMFSRKYMAKEILEVLRA